MCKLDSEAVEDPVVFADDDIATRDATDIREALSEYFMSGQDTCNCLFLNYLSIIIIIIIKHLCRIAASVLGKKLLSMQVL